MVVIVHCSSVRSSSSVRPFNEWKAGKCELASFSRKHKFRAQIIFRIWVSDTSNSRKYHGVELLMTPAPLPLRQRIYLFLFNLSLRQYDWRKIAIHTDAYLLKFKQIFICVSYRSIDADLKFNGELNTGIVWYNRHHIFVHTIKWKQQSNKTFHLKWFLSTVSARRIFRFSELLFFWCK